MVAFYGAMVGLLERHAHLMLATEIGASCFATGAYGFGVMALLIAAELPAAGALSDMVLAPLSPDLYRHQRRPSTE
ncbi:hypothetical protein AB0J74_20935 [Asanoa sp. NPDC049573]|uniref:hypothetical protein n=1 Tax=Asanoa sp. NPDC049573 TaxID=3155396 RepID=UPI003442AB30